MKTNIAKQIALWITVILAGIIAVLFSASKASANRFKKPGSRISRASNATKKTFTNESDAMQSILASTTGLKPNVLKLALNGYQWAENQGKVKNNKYLTVIDFTMRSNLKRMWIINMNTDKVVMNTLVANGKGSGLNNGTRFSNRPGSLESSLGIYVTGVHYYGNDGLSLHVHGLQAGINTNAYSRTIEFHGAWYVSPTFAKEHGRVGRSWGCFALDKAILPKVVKTIENGTVVFAYAKNHSEDYQAYANS